MAGRLNWSKANLEKKVREQNYELYRDSLAQSPPQPSKPKKNKTPQKTTPKSSAKKRAGVERRALSRLHYIKAVWLHVETGVDLPPLYKKLAPKLKREIQKASSIVDWAKTQPEYASFGKDQADAKKATKPSKTKRWRSDLGSDISKLEAELRAVEIRRKALMAEIRRKKKALAALG